MEIIPALKLFISKGRLNNGGQHMQLSYLPNDRGEIFSNEEGKHYAYDGKIRFATQRKKLCTLHIKIVSKPVKNDKLEIHIFNQIDEVGLGVDTNIVLEKSPCI